LIFGRALDTAIPRPIVGAAVVVVFAIRLIVFLVVGDEVVDGEPVMGGDEIDAGPSLATAMVEAERRGARALAATSPRQKSRTVSRNLSFHSAQPGGKPPT
jgi:hypothetical protein